MDTIELPTSYLHKTTLNVRLDDINYANHLDFSRIVCYLANCRASFFKKHNFKEIDDSGIGIITRSVKVNFKKQSFFDDTITICMDIDNVKPASLDLIYGVYITDPLGELDEVARAVINLAFIDFNSNKPCKIPTDFLHIIDTSPKFG